MNIRILPIILLPFLLATCSYFNGTPLENELGADENLISFSYTITQKLVENARTSLQPGNPDMPILVTTFVDNNDLTRTSQFGRILQEHIISRLVQLGYTVKEIKLRDQLLIKPKSGETILSRDLRLIKPSLTAQAILVGTYSRAGRTMYISARLINPETSAIVSSVDNRLIMDPTVMAMFGVTPAGDDQFGPIDKPKMSLFDRLFY
jgi:TolB-like protein